MGLANKAEPNCNPNQDNPNALRCLQSWFSYFETSPRSILTLCCRIANNLTPESRRTDVSQRALSTQSDVQGPQSRGPWVPWVPDARPQDQRRRRGPSDSGIPAEEVSNRKDGAMSSPRSLSGGQLAKPVSTDRFQQNRPKIHNEMNHEQRKYELRTTNERTVGKNFNQRRRRCYR